MLVLYDVTSTYLEGRCCPLARHGDSRDSRGDRRQLVIGLLCAADGCPVAVEVFVTRRRAFARRQNRRSGHRGVAGRQAEAALPAAPRGPGRRPRHAHRRAHRANPASGRTGLDWITAPRGPAIQQFAAAGGPLQFFLFDTRDMAEISSPDYPDERLVVCKNPLLAEERRRKRDELLALTEADLGKIQTRVGRKKPLVGPARSARRSARSWASARWFLKQIEALFVQVLGVAREMGVLKLGTLALDGTKTHANASRHSALSSSARRS
jgi:hypothetical protein